LIKGGDKTKDAELKKVQGMLKQIDDQVKKSKARFEYLGKQKEAEQKADKKKQEEKKMKEATDKAAAF
jgi:hypothetical protein